MKLLIIGIKGDYHLDAVKWGLAQHDVDPTVWYWSDFPNQDMLSFSMPPDGTHSVQMSIQGRLITAPYDVIWARRKGQPVAIEGAHPDDLKIIQNESREFINNLVPFLSNKTTRMVNDFTADRLCFNKLHQLRVAHSAGFSIPDTLVTNDIEQVRQFFKKHNGKIIHKAFGPGAWDNEDGSRTVQRTSLLSEEHLKQEYSIRACPSIYQSCVPKNHELRVTVIGDTVMAAAIFSQEDGETIDWRFEGGKGHTNLKAVQLDTDTRQRCLAVCRAMGLNYGCIDLIVTPAGLTIFLEVNNIGQFLWKEFSDPSLHLLDTFCRFLLNKPGTKENILKLSDYKKYRESNRP